MSVVKDFFLTVVKKNKVVSVVSEVKQPSERSRKFQFDSSEVEQRSGWSCRFDFNSSDSDTV